MNNLAQTLKANDRTSLFSLNLSFDIERFTVQ
jgi:hypothetical protein